MTERQQDSYLEKLVKNISVDQENYLNTQLYYFTPFLRKFYELLGTSFQHDTTFQATALEQIKNVAHYYGKAIAFGSFDIGQEQTHINNLYKVIHTHMSTDELKNAFNQIQEWTFNKNDGYTNEYLYGSKACQELIPDTLPGKPYKMRASGGLADLSQKSRIKLLFPLATFIEQNRANDAVSVWGNVASGVSDAAAIHATLEALHVPTTFHLFRASTHAFSDTAVRSVAEPKTIPGWAIGVDSFSNGGKSVPLMSEFLEGLSPRKTSIYLTVGGHNWTAKYPQQYTGGDGIATLLRMPERRV